MAGSRRFVKFGVVEKLDVSVFLKMTFIDNVIKSIHLAERKIVPYHSLVVPNLMVYEARGASEKNTLVIRQFITRDPALFVTPTTGKPK